MRFLLVVVVTADLASFASASPRAALLGAATFDSQTLIVRAQAQAEKQKKAASKKPAAEKKTADDGGLAQDSIHGVCNPNPCK